MAVRLCDVLDNTHYQIENQVFDTDEISVRFHRQLVWIHAFPKGNGRHARLMADLLALHLGRARLTWGDGEPSDAPISSVRDRYIAALHAADQVKFNGLIALTRSDCNAVTCAWTISPEIGGSREQFGQGAQPSEYALHLA